VLLKQKINFFFRIIFLEERNCAHCSRISEMFIVRKTARPCASPTGKQNLLKLQRHCSFNLCQNSLGFQRNALAVWHTPFALSPVLFNSAAGIFAKFRLRVYRAVFLLFSIVENL